MASLLHRNGDSSPSQDVTDLVEGRLLFRELWRRPEVSLRTRPSPDAIMRCEDLHLQELNDCSYRLSR
jgi:hypothetical protein